MAGVKDVFRESRYLFFAIFIAWFVFSLALWLPQWKLILQVLNTASSVDSVVLLVSLYTSLGSNFTLGGALIVVILSGLFGVNISLTLYLYRKQFSIQKGVATNIWGATLGILGVGCAACGSVILTSLLSLFGGVWLLSYLPLGGEEFGFIGIALLLYGTYSLSKKISSPMVCED